MCCISGARSLINQAKFPKFHAQILVVHFSSDPVQAWVKRSLMLVVSTQPTQPLLGALILLISSIYLIVEDLQADYEARLHYHPLMLSFSLEVAAFYVYNSCAFCCCVVLLALICSKTRYCGTWIDWKWTVESKVYLWFSLSSRHWRKDGLDWPNVSSGTHEHDYHRLYDDLL